MQEKRLWQPVFDIKFIYLIKTKMCKCVLDLQEEEMSVMVSLRI